MRKLGLSGVVVAAALVVSAAGAAPIGDASITVDVGGLGPVSLQVSGVGGDLGILAGAATLPASALTGTGIGNSPPGAPPISGLRLRIQGHPTGVFAPGNGPGGGLGGIMPLSGTYAATGFGGITLLAVPLGVIGGGGTTTVTGGGGTFVQVFGTGWTTGTATVAIGSTTVEGMAQTPTVATAKGGDFRTAGGGGALVLVSPALVRTNLAGDLPTFATLTLGTLQVPEPGTLGLLGTAIGGLALLGRRRSRR